MWRHYLKCTFFAEISILQRSTRYSACVIGKCWIRQIRVLWWENSVIIWLSSPETEAFDTLSPLHQGIWYISVNLRLYYNWGWQKSTCPQKFVLCWWGNIKLNNQVDSISATHAIRENKPMGKKTNKQIRTKKNIDKVAVESVVLSGRLTESF